MGKDEDDFFNSAPAPLADAAPQSKLNQVDSVSLPSEGFAQELAAVGSGSFANSADEQAELDKSRENSGAEIEQGQQQHEREKTEQSSDASRDPSAAASKAKAAIESSLPPALRILLGQYFVIAQKLIFSPLKFFKEMDLGTGIAEPLIFLSVSAVGTAIISAVFHNFNLLKIPGDAIGLVIIGFVVSGISYMMAKGMGSKASFPSVFRIFAYSSCLSVLSPVPGIGLLVPVYALVLQFLGLREIVKVSMYQTCTLMFLLCFLQIIISLGQLLHP